MKKVFIIIILLITAACHKNSKSINIYIQENVIPEKVLQEYSKYGVDVKSDTYKNNIEFYSTIRYMDNGGYDLFLPSTFMVTQLYKKGLVTPIDIKKIENIENIINLFFVQPYETAKQYSVPYLTDSLGIIINTKYVNEADITKWDDLWQLDSKSSIVIKEDMRDFFSIALKALGYTANSMVDGEIKEAYDKLTQLLPKMRIMKFNEIKTSLISEQYVIGIVYYSESYLLIKENPNLKFISPKDGSLMWVRSFTVPKTSDNIKNTYKFIEYMIKPEVASQVLSEYGTIPLLNYDILKPYISKELQAHYEKFMSEENLKKLEIQRDIGLAVNTYVKYWDMLLGKK